MTVEGSVSGNTAGGGGGIFNQSTLTLGTTGQVENNDSTNNGGGIANLSSGTVTLQTGSRVAATNAVKGEAGSTAVGAR